MNSNSSTRNTTYPLGHIETFKCITDSRGSLCVAQSDLLHEQFDIKRIFWIHGVPEGAVRGEHANRSCSELLVAVRGSVKVWLTDGFSEKEILLDNPREGLYIPPMVWCKLKDFTSDCVCLCLADQNYDETLYINQYEQFLNETSHGCRNL